MIRLDIDWVYLRLTNQVLAEYILSTDVYRALTPIKTVDSVGELSQLAIGNILLSLKRLQISSLSDNEQADLAELCQQIEQVRERWRANWERKARSERVDRQAYWQKYLNELAIDKNLNSRTYPSKVRSREIIDLLDEEIGYSEINTGIGLEQQDIQLRSISSNGPFVWEEGLENGFSQERCWFLYRNFQ